MLNQLDMFAVQLKPAVIINKPSVIQQSVYDHLDAEHGLKKLQDYPMIYQHESGLIIEQARSRHVYKGKHGKCGFEEKLCCIFVFIVRMES